MKNHTRIPTPGARRKAALGACVLLLLSLACNLTSTPTPEISAEPPQISDTPLTASTTQVPDQNKPTPTHTPTPTGDTSGPPPDPSAALQATWEAQTCQATILSRRDQVAMEISGFLENTILVVDDEVLLVQGANLNFSSQARADINYGGGNKITIYGPSAGSGTMKIIEWNGARQVAIDAGAGRVIEDDQTGCTTEVVALGTVTLVTTGTDYAFVVDPNLPGGGNQVQLAVFSGSVKAVDASGADMATWNPGNAGLITNGAVEGIFENPGSRADILERLENGQDIFGTPLDTSGTPATSLTLWTAWEGRQLDRLNEVISLYQEQNPNISFSITNQPAGDLLRLYQAAIESGQPPDLLIGPGAWAPGLIREGSVADLSGQIDETVLKSLLIAARQAAQDRRSLTSLPLTARGVVLFRNKTLMPERPRTLEELLGMAKDATARGIFGYSFDIGVSFSAAHLAGLGGRLMDEKNNPAFDDDYGYSWLTMLRQLQDYGQVVMDNNQDLELFESGQAGFLIDWSSNFPQLADSIGEDNLAIDPWPNYQGGSLAGFLTTENIYLSPQVSPVKTSPAIAFMEFLLNPSAQAILAGDGQLPSIRTLEGRGAFIRQGTNALRGAVPLPTIPEMNAYWDPLAHLIQNVVFNGFDIGESLAGAYKEIYATIDQYR